ncbi:MAG TPA: saccharopine dehydrogenase C-terminal domain-containing protein [Amycolatopsis sp.]|nr:saccharopine dehydrogenase C-terminal domain-containing protein [Amycolatopsis sp.]
MGDSRAAARLALLGCGQMGRSAAYALATERDTAELTLLDRDRSRAEGVARWLAGHATCRVTVAGTIEEAVRRRDAVAMALPWAATRDCLDAAVRAGVPVASVTRPPYAELVELASRAGAGSSPVLLPIGLEPGLTELLAVHASGLLDRVDTVHIGCGGIPRRPREPWGYTAFFGGEQADHLPIAQRDALSARGGRVVAVPRFSGVETREIEDVGLLEAYHDGMVPWLPEHPAFARADCTQKTLRWPGFASRVGELARLGLLGERPVDVDGTPVIPRRLVERVVAPQVRPEPHERDLVVLDVLAHGVAAGRAATVRTRLLDAFDPDTGLSAIARTTGFTLAAATRLLAEGRLPGKGWRKPHLAVTGPLFAAVMSALTTRGVRWSAAGHVTPAGPAADACRERKET